MFDIDPIRNNVTMNCWKIFFYQPFGAMRDRDRGIEFLRRITEDAWEPLPQRIALTKGVEGSNFLCSLGLSRNQWYNRIKRAMNVSQIKAFFGFNLLYPSSALPSYGDVLVCAIAL